MPEFKYDLTYSGGTITLDRDPVGWEDAVLKLKRDTDYHGVFKEYTFDLQFHCLGGGKPEIDGDYDTHGIQADVTIAISYKCAEDDSYTEIFDGKLDFSKYERTKDFTTVTIIRNDLSKIVMSRMDTDVELSTLDAIDGGTLTDYTYANYDLNMHCKKVLKQTEFGGACGINRRYRLGFTGVLSYDHWYEWTTLEESNSFTGSNDFDLILDDYNAGQINSSSELDIEVNPNAPGTLNPAPSHIFEANENTPSTIDIDYSFSGNFTDFPFGVGSGTRGYNSDVTIRIYKGTGSLAGASLVHTSAAVVSSYTANFNQTESQNFNISGSYQATSVSSGDRFWVVFFGTYFSPPPIASIVDLRWNFQNNSVIFSADTDFDETKARVWAVHEALSRVCESITGQVSPSASTGITAFYSSFFGRTNSQPVSYLDNGCGSFTALTNGAMIREFFPLEDAGSVLCYDSVRRGVFMSLGSIFEAMNTIYNVGLGVEYKTDRYAVVVEPKTYFYDKTTTILSCPNIDELTMRFESEWCYNDAVIGFDKWEVEDFNGTDEPITKQHRALPGLRQLKNEYNAVTKFVAAMYAIEYTRRQSVKELGTTDTDFDNDNFVIALNRAVDAYTNEPSALDEAEKDENFASVTGLFEPDTAYNLRFSPVRCLLRHLNVLGSGLTKGISGNDKKLIFSKGYNNYEMTGDMDSDGCAGDFTANPITETTTISWDEANARLNEPLWVPEVYTFDYPLSFSEWLSLVNSPYGVVEFSETSANFKKGYILNLDYQINKGLATFELLRAYE